MFRLHGRNEPTDGSLPFPPTRRQRRRENLSPERGIAGETNCYRLPIGDVGTGVTGIAAAWEAARSSRQEATQTRTPTATAKPQEKK